MPLMSRSREGWGGMGSSEILMRVQPHKDVGRPMREVSGQRVWDRALPVTRALNALRGLG